MKPINKNNNNLNIVYHHYHHRIMNRILIVIIITLMIGFETLNINVNAAPIDGDDGDDVVVHSRTSQIVIDSNYRGSSSINSSTASSPLIEIHLLRRPDLRYMTPEKLSLIFTMIRYIQDTLYPPFFDTTSASTSSTTPTTIIPFKSAISSNSMTTTTRKIYHKQQQQQLNSNKFNHLWPLW